MRDATVNEMGRNGNVARAPYGASHHILFYRILHIHPGSGRRGRREQIG